METTKSAQCFAGMENELHDLGLELAKVLRAHFKKKFGNVASRSVLYGRDDIALKFQYDMPDDLIALSLRVGGLEMRYVDLHELDGSENYVHDIDLSFDYRSDLRKSGPMRLGH